MMTKVWREISRIVDVHGLGHRLGPILAEELPISALIIRGIDVGQMVMSTMARWDHDELSLPPIISSPSVSISEGDMKRFMGWHRSGRILYLSHSGPSGEAEYFMDRLVDRDVIIGVLGDELHLSGLLIIVSRRMATFSGEALDIAGQLLEPLAIALQNNRRYQRITIDREAAESERLSLLRKLGRDQLDQKIVGMDSGLRHVMERVEYVSRSDVAVLIFGETGSGKEVIARAIHDRSSRLHGPFVRVNCGAVPSELIDSELFGHERGSFTGAINMRKGWFERGDGGTLFLDEVAELPLAAQVRLLRVLQDGTFQRVGGQQDLHVDVRIIAATHRDLQTMVAEQRFREDLWYRLSVFPIDLPSLRERPEDIAALAEHFARRSSKRFGLAYQAPSLSDIDLLMIYPWPGNIRELASVIDRAAILGNGQRLEIEKALGVIRPPVKIAVNDITDETRISSGRFLPLDDIILNHIRSALTLTRGRIEGPIGAATLLKINPQTLRSKMRKFHIRAKDFRSLPQ